MPAISDREKRTIRIAVVLVAVYLLLFFGWRGRSYLEERRAEYQKLVADAKAIKLKLEPYEKKTEEIKKLMAIYKLDPATLTRATVVAEATAAIQKAAAGGIMIGPIRESGGRPSARELASVKLEASGQVQQLMAFLLRLDALGYPLVVEDLQISAAGGGGGRPGMPPMGGGPPGMLKASVTIVILDYEQWKKENKNV